MPYPGVGNNDKIIPCTIEQDDLGNLNACILSSGVLLLDSFFNHRQRRIRAMDVANIKKYFEVAHFKMQHLFCWRQRLFNCNKLNTLAYKPHGCCHFSMFTPLYGPPPNYDTQLCEGMHKTYAKKAYKASSRRNANKLEDMINGLQHSRLAMVLKTEIFGKGTDEIDDGEEEDDIVTTRANVATYTSDDNVVYEGSTLSNTRELILNRDNREDLQYKPNSKLTKLCLSPNTTLALLWSAIQRCTNTRVETFCMHFGILKGVK